MYQTVRNILSSNNPDTEAVRTHVTGMGHLAVNLYNASLFRIRQLFIGWDKEDSARSANEKEVFLEKERLEKAYPGTSVRRVISYSHLEKMMRVTHNPDFFAGLPMQTAQHVVKQAAQDFKNWLAALKAYKADPSKFFSCPRMPGYKKKGSVCTFPVTNQDAVLYPGKDHATLKLPLMKERLSISGIPENGRLKEVRFKPFYDSWLLLMTFETDFVPAEGMPNIGSIDFGEENIAALAVNDSYGLICKGGALKSEIRWFNKQRAGHVSELDKRFGTHHGETPFLKELSRKYRCFMDDQCHKVSRAIVNTCISHKVGTLVLGRNKNWKQGVNLGKHNDQMVAQMPLARLRDMIAYKAQMAGIAVIEQEESYTSKADFLSHDYIPTYGVDDEKASFSGKRKGRGLYVSGTGIIVNADMNAAANILVKAIPEAFRDTKKFNFLSDPEVMGFREWNKRIAVEGIAGAVNHPLAGDKETVA